MKFFNVSDGTNAFPYIAVEIVDKFISEAFIFWGGIG